MFLIRESDFYQRPDGGAHNAGIKLSLATQGWDHSHMGEQENVQPAEGAATYSVASEERGDPTTQQMRTVGQRRREAERKLDLHLEEASHKDGTSVTEGEGHSEG